MTQADLSVKSWENFDPPFYIQQNLLQSKFINFRYLLGKQFCFMFNNSISQRKILFDSTEEIKNNSGNCVKAGKVLAWIF